MTPSATTREKRTPMEVLAHEYLAAWQAHDVDAIIALHTEDSVYTSAATGREAVGRQEFRTVLGEIFAVWPDLRFHPHRIYTTDQLIVAESIAKTTPALPLPLGDSVAEPTGASVTFAVADILAIEDGLVKRKDTYLDALGYLRQLRAGPL